MARSEEALHRRAEKRQRSLQEQKQIDLEDVRRQQKKRKEEEKGAMQRQHENAAPADPLKEVGAWTCRSCSNENFASRRVCNSRTCDEPRPSHIAPAPKRNNSSHRMTNNRFSKRPRTMDGPGAWRCDACGSNNFATRNRCFNRDCGQSRPHSSSSLFGGRDQTRNKPKRRHDEATSKTLVWAKQASTETLTKNQELRKRYLETGGGEGLTEEEIDRAKMLIARDERKRQKKKKKKKEEPEHKNLVEETPDTTGDKKEIKTKGKTVSSKSQRDKNTALRRLYSETGGKGMNPEQIERAKKLIDRAERKQKRRAETKKLEESQ